MGLVEVVRASAVKLSFAVFLFSWSRDMVGWGLPSWAGGLGFEGFKDFRLKV